jgi:hypothetical protein
MSVYGKRTATSPKENMSKKSPQELQLSSHETDSEKLVKIELETRNDKPFFGQITDDEILYIWVTVFGRKKEELFGTASTKTLTRNVRVTYKLNAPIKLNEAFDGGNFRYEKYLDEGACEVVTGKILGYGAQKPVQLGELAKVTIKTNLGVEPAGLLNWLKLYGTPTTYGFSTNARTGLKTEFFEAEIILRRHIDEYLPIYGQKCQVSYPGQPRMCNRCYGTGHLRRDCNNKKKDWIQYVIELVDSGVPVEFIGVWKNAIERHNKANANPEKA